MMLKAVLQHPGGSVDLFEGEITIGRGLSCPIRFNDHSVSRKHVRLSITADSIIARDLGSRNGTKLNGSPLEAKTVLQDRDILQIGSVQLRLVLITTRQTFMDEVVTRPDVVVPEEGDPAVQLLSAAAWGGGTQTSRASDAAEDAPKHALDDQAQAGLETAPSRPAIKRASRASSQAGDRAAPSKKHGAITLVRDSTELPLPELIARTCPDCRTQVPMSQEQCHRCGYKWQLRGPMSKTQPIIISSLAELGLDQQQHDRAMERRAADRVDVEVPIIYHSENLTFDARAHNVSRSGMFIASDLLDAIGTTCTLRVLPDGHAAISIGGMVKHVVTSTNAEKDQVPGMGIRFQKMSHGALSWIWSVLGDPLAE